MDILTKAKTKARTHPVHRVTEERTVRLAVGRHAIEGTLGVPEGSSGIVVFAHGSGSGRHSPRNRHVAGVLQGAGLATLLLDLLTAEEAELDERTRVFRFDVDLLSGRLITAARWVRSEPGLEGLRLGCFGASTGAAAALIAAAREPERVSAVVSRGGRPDLAGVVLPRVKAPTLLIVGGRDPEVLQLNREAFDQLRCDRRLAIVPGATHLFEEPGALDEAARLAQEWFTRYLPAEATVYH